MEHEMVNAVEILVDLLFLIDMEAEDPAAVHALVKLSREPLDLLKSRVNPDESRERTESGS